MQKNSLKQTNKQTNETIISTYKSYFKFKDDQASFSQPKAKNFRSCACHFSVFDKLDWRVINNRAFRTKHCDNFEYSKRDK